MGRRTTKKINKRNSGKKPRLMLFLLFIVFILTGILLIIKLWDNEVDSERKLLDEEVSAIMEAEKADITIENDGGYILGPSHVIQAGTPPENIEALFETVYDLGERRVRGI